MAQRPGVGAPLGENKNEPTLGQGVAVQLITTDRWLTLKMWNFGLTPLYPPLLLQSGSVGPATPTLHSRDARPLRQPVAGCRA